MVELYLQEFKITKSIICPIVPNIPKVSWSLLPRTDRLAPTKCIPQPLTFYKTTTYPNQSRYMKSHHSLSINQLHSKNNIDTIKSHNSLMNRLHVNRSTCEHNIPSHQDNVDTIQSHHSLSMNWWHIKTMPIPCIPHFIQDCPFNCCSHRTLFHLH